MLVVRTFGKLKLLNIPTEGIPEGTLSVLCIIHFFNCIQILYLLTCRDPRPKIPNSIIEYHNA